MKHDILSAGEIKAGAEVHIYPTLESTNDTAKTMPNASHGTLVVADTQTAGRGRHGRKFFSPPGCGIYMSIVLNPNQFPDDIFNLITPMAAVAVCEAIEDLTDKAPQIKWVNDVLLDGKKICGILTETAADAGGQISRIIVGIGINFTPPPSGYPPEINETTAALFTRPPITRNQLIAEITSRLLAGYTKDALLTEYKKRLAILARRITIITADTTYKAIALDIEDNCGLIIQKETGEILTLTAGEISIR